MPWFGSLFGSHFDLVNCVVSCRVEVLRDRKASLKLLMDEGAHHGAEVRNDFPNLKPSISTSFRNSRAVSVSLYRQDRHGK